MFQELCVTLAVVWAAWGMPDTRRAQGTASRARVVESLFGTCRWWGYGRCLAGVDLSQTSRAPCTGRPPARDTLRAKAAQGGGRVAAPGPCRGVTSATRRRTQGTKAMACDALNAGPSRGVAIGGGGPETRRGARGGWGRSGRTTGYCRVLGVKWGPAGGAPCGPCRERAVGWGKAARRAQARGVAGAQGAAGKPGRERGHVGAAGGRRRHTGGAATRSARPTSTRQSAQAAALLLRRPALLNQTRGASVQARGRRAGALSLPSGRLLAGAGRKASFALRRSECLFAERACLFLSAGRGARPAESGQVMQGSLKVSRAGQQPPPSGRARPETARVGPLALRGGTQRRAGGVRGCAAGAAAANISRL